MRPLAVLAALLACTASPAAPPFPGGILDSTGRTAYLASEAGIDAIDLARGERIWQSRDAQLPLLVAGDRLYAVALAPTSRLAIVAFDLASRAERVFRTEVTDFPRWVSTRGTPTQTFHCGWRQDRHTLFLDWRADSRDGAGPGKHAAGQVRVDLDTGRVEAGGPVVLHAPRPAEGVPPRLEKHAVRWQGRAGGQRLAAVLEELPGSGPGHRKQRLVLRGWDERTGKEGPPRELLQGGRLVLLPDLDGKHLWLRDAAANPEGADGPAGADAPAHHWQVVSVLDGHLVARAPFVPGTQQATCVGQRAYCLAVAPARTSLDAPPPRVLVLHAIDLEAGRPLWRRTLGTPAVP